MTIYSIFNEFDMNQPTDPPIHLSKGWSVSTNHKYSNKIQLYQLDNTIYSKFLMNWHEPTHWPTYPYSYLKVESVTKNHKYSNIIEVSHLDQNSIQFVVF